VPYAELWLAKLAVQASSAWNDLMNQTGRSELVDRTGVLWFGNPSVVTSEGQIKSARDNMIALNQECTYLEDEEEIKSRYPWIASGVEKGTVSLFCSDGGTIDIRATVNALVDGLYASNRAIIRENSKVEKINYNENGVIITTNSNETYRAKKVILTPGAYVNNVLNTLQPTYPERLSMIIYLWSSIYYKIKTNPSQVSLQSGRLPRPSTDKWPVWIFFGPAPEIIDNDKPVNMHNFYGFPSDISDSPFDVRVCPSFTSQRSFDYIDYPPKITDRAIDEAAVGFTSEFVSKWMDGWVDSTRTDNKSTCIAGFATLASPQPGKSDAGQGFVLDILPGTHGNVVLCTGGWAMKFVPLFGRILADLALNGQAPDYDINEMRWNRGITKKHVDIQKGTKSTDSQMERWLHFAHLTCGTSTFDTQ